MFLRPQMPRGYYKPTYRKRTYRKRTYTRRRNTYARKKWSPSIKYKSETKWYDGTAGGGGIGNMPAAWNRYDLSCPITQGVTSVSRVGNNIIAKSLGISFDVTRNASSSTPQQRMRFMVIDYPRSEGSIPAAAEFFQTTGVFLPQRNLSWVKEFHVLADRVITVDSASRNSQMGKAFPI
ncbi:capsid protein [Sewage-associated circular DNA virus-12]|uniref:capsid protein n=1 Tax=Sewage-associated circular DNA virus-12 TaxID=1519388 RepID=UPI0004D0B6EF|nr:capsid protein [Sewage-associated circular DNA virus-12]AIF34801.1 capsid protein [Sewage-associated circular DNA virus-12]